MEDLVVHGQLSRAVFHGGSLFSRAHAEIPVAGHRAVGKEAVVVAVFLGEGGEGCEGGKGGKGGKDGKGGKGFEE